MKPKKLQLYFSLLCIHTLIAFIAFNKFLLHPFGTLFCDYGDGLKNTFTLISYVKEPLSPAGILKYNAMSYPFGDYVYFTDNTPLFSIPFRWFCLHVADISAYTVVIFNVLVIANIVLSGLLLFYIFRSLLKENLFSYIMAVVLPWANMQLMRVWRGHYNLSLTSLILLAIVLLILWHKYRQERKKQIVVGIALVILSYFSFLAHGYYLPILTMFIGAMLFFYGILNFKEKQGKFSLLAALVYLIAATGLSVATLLITDKNFAIRKSTANGYDDPSSKTHFSALLNHYSFQTVYFPFPFNHNTTEPELAAYLGNIGLYAVFIFAIIALVNKSFRRQMILVQKDFFKDPLKAAIVLGSLVLFFVSLGEIYSIDLGKGNTIHLLNIFNPFFYLHNITRKVEQFRCLERFIWPFFFAFYIWITYVIAAVFRQSAKPIRITILLSVLFLGGAEARDHVIYMRKEASKENCFSQKNLDKIVPARIHTGMYQAILPIPYYYIGSEYYDLTFDDNDEWSNYTFRLSLATGLPLMSSKMSRTPRLFNEQLVKFVAYDSLIDPLKTKLNSKAILVVYNKRLLQRTHVVLFDKDAKKFYGYCLQFVSRNNLQPIDSANGVFFYNYYPKQAATKQ